MIWIQETGCRTQTDQKVSKFWQFGTKLILDQDPDPKESQNLIDLSQPTHQVSWKSVNRFLSNTVNRQTDKPKWLSWRKAMPLCIHIDNFKVMTRVTQRTQQSTYNNVSLTWPIQIYILTHWPPPHHSKCHKKDGYRQQNVRQRQILISIIDYDVCMTFY